MNILYFLYFPFEGIGRFLRALSLHSGIGNLLAFFLYVCLALLPLGAEAVWFRKAGRRPRAVELLPLLLGVYSFYLLYAFVNPHIFYKSVPALGGDAEFLPVIKSFWAGLWYLLFFSYPLLCLVEKLGQEAVLDRKEYLCWGLGNLLLCTMLLYGGAALWGAGARATVFSGEASRNAAVTSLDWLFAGLRILAALIPQTWFLYVLHRGRQLLGALEKGPYAPETVEAARALSRAAVESVRISVLVSLIWNGALFLCRGMLADVSYRMDFPLLPLGIAFAALILARYFKEAGELYQDNEMII